MPKSIETLVPDILSLFEGNKIVLSDGLLSAFTQALTKKIGGRIEEERGAGTLRMSSMGKKCERQLWYSVNMFAKAEKLPPEARIKFMYGDILEEMLLYLAKEAGHAVEREQEVVELYGVVGHIDAIVDGVLIDCKSASSYGYLKFAAGLEPASDDFGYLTQLDSYLHALSLPRGGFLAIDKTLGKICLDLHDRTDTDYELVIARKRATLAQSVPPDRAFVAEADGKSGNKKLGVACSYCAFKETCWPNLRTFYYSNGPRFLTEVRRTPDVDEASVRSSGD